MAATGGVCGTGEIGGGADETEFGEEVSITRGAEGVCTTDGTGAEQGQGEEKG